MESVYRLGMGVSVSTAGSVTGSAKAEAVIAAVVLDEQGRIVDMIVDGAEIRIPVADGAIAGTDRTTVFKTRYEKRDLYGENSEIALWCAQTDEFCSRAMGRTISEIAQMEDWEVMKKEGAFREKTEEAAMLKTAVLKAGKDCEASAFAAGDYRLGLEVLSKVDPSSKSASEKQPGLAGLFSSFVAVALDDNGKVLAVLADAVEPKIVFRQNGTIGETIYQGSMRETSDLSWMDSWKSRVVGRVSGQIEAECGPEDLVYPAYRKLAAKASVFHKDVLVNSLRYPVGETVKIPITDVVNDRFAAVMTEDNITYRMLTEEEQRAGRIEVTAFSDMSVKFYRYGFFIDNRCVIAGDSDKNRILLSDYLPEGYENYYCFGYDSNSGTMDTDGVGCMCATNDLWKVFHVRYVYSGFYQVQVVAGPDREVVMQNREKAYKAAPIPAGAVFPFCDADNPEHLQPMEGGRRIMAGTYYVKKGTVFTDGVVSYKITENSEICFS